VREGEGKRQEKQKMKRKYGQGEDNIFAAPPIAPTADSSFSCVRKQISTTHSQIFALSEKMYAYKFT